MNSRDEADVIEEFKRIANLVPPWRGDIHPPQSILARVWALINAPKGEEDFIYAESHFKGDNSRSAWQIVVADSTHLVQVQADVPVSNWWGRPYMADFSSLSRMEGDIDVSARRLSFNRLCEVKLAGTHRDWLTFGGPPQAPAWDLCWGSDVSVRLPIDNHHLASKARALVLSLNR